MGKFRSVSNHVEDLADGRTVAPGEVVELSASDLKDSFNERLVSENVLIDASEQKQDKQDEEAKKQEGR